MLSSLKIAIATGDQIGIRKEIETLANKYNLSVGNIRSARPVFNRTASEWAELAQEMMGSAERNQVDGKLDRVGVSMSLVYASWVAEKLDEKEKMDFYERAIDNATNNDLHIEPKQLTLF